MTGGTLIVTRDVDNHSYFKKQAEQFGFRKVAVTELERDGLNYVINDLSPRLIVMESRFYDCATPYMISLLHRRFPKINKAVVSLERYPEYFAIGLIANGVESYVNFSDGAEQFFTGLRYIKEGKAYISPKVAAKMKNKELPKASNELTERQIEVARLLCNGYTALEIADVLEVSDSTVNHHKSELYNNLKIRNEKELIRVALYLELIKVEELNFYGRKYK